MRKVKDLFNRITGKAELTRDESNNLCTPSPSTKLRKGVEGRIIHDSVAVAVARTVFSK